MADRSPILRGDIKHEWDAIRATPTTIDNVHESVYRAFQILQEVRMMLERGDSAQTVSNFIYWARLNELDVNRTMDGGS